MQPTAPSVKGRMTRMNLRWITFSRTTAIIVFFISSCLSADDAAPKERVRLTQAEHVIYQFIVEHRDREGDIPTKETIEQALSSPITNERRAKLSAKMYYENGIIGALFSDDESFICAHLFHHLRGSKSVKELVTHIGKVSDRDISPTRIMNSLEFLYSAGYIDVRKNGDEVYLVLPRGMATLYMASSLKEIEGSDEIFEKKGDGTKSFFEKGPIPLEDNETAPHEGDTSGTEESFDFLESPKITTPPPTESVNIDTAGTSPPPEKSIQETHEEMSAEKKEPAPSENAQLPQADPVLPPEPHATVISVEPLGPPAPSMKTEKREREYSGFSRAVLEERGRKLLPCAPDFWGWPYLYGQRDVEILTATSDTGSEVRIIIRDGQLISCKPQGIIVFSEGQHGDIHFFLSEHNLHQWRLKHPDIQGDVMTVSDALAWARKFLQ